MELINKQGLPESLKNEVRVKLVTSGKSKSPSDVKRAIKIHEQKGNIDFAISLAEEHHQDEERLRLYEKKVSRLIRYQNAGNYQEAGDICKNVLGDTERADEFYEEAILKSIKKGVFYQSYEECFFSITNPDLKQELMWEVISFYTEGREGRGKSDVNLARFAKKTGQTEIAKEAYLRLVNKYKNMVEDLYEKPHQNAVAYAKESGDPHMLANLLIELRHKGRAKEVIKEHFSGREAEDYLALVNLL